MVIQMKKHKITMLIAVILILIPTICFGAIDIFDTPDNISVNDYSMVISEETKTLPFGDVWEEYCKQEGVIADETWFGEVEKYEKEVLSKRG